MPAREEGAGKEAGWSAGSSEPYRISAFLSNMPDILILASLSRELNPYFLGHFNPHHLHSQTKIVGTPILGGRENGKLSQFRLRLWVKTVFSSSSYCFSQSLNLKSRLESV